MLRLLPAFLVMLAVCIAASSILLNEHKHGANIQAAILSAMYVLNFRGYFDFYAKSLFVHCWSLAVEEQFYLIWPLVLWASLASGGIARTTRGVVQLALVAVLLRCYLASRGCHWDNIYEWPHSRADSLLVGCFVGCFVGCCYHAQAVAWVKQHDRALVRLMTAGTAALAAFGWSVSTGQFKGYLQYLGFTHVALVGGLLVAHVVMAGEGKLKGLLEHRALVHLGRISYGLYLWHYPVIKVLRGNVEWWAIPLIAAPGSYALAIASFRYVEQPMLRFKDRHGTRPGHETDRRRRTDMALPEPLPDGSHKDDPQPIQTPPGSGFRAV